MALHEQALGATDEWYTPPHVFAAMGVQFDLDVAHPAERLDWIPAAEVMTWGSLDRPWQGFVWMNPPFGGRNGLVPWLNKFFAHGDGVALVPGRTLAPWWQDYAPRAELLLFVSPKIRFIGADGRESKSPAQGTTLFAVGARGRTALVNANRAGLGFLLRNEDTLAGVRE